MERRRVKSIPNAVRVTEGLRNTGYTPETAIADLIDNSISADATQINVNLSQSFDKKHTVWIGDNGCGMNEATLERAMQYGSSKELAKNGLSVYGLGMKMASTSFTKRFTVVTREKNGTAFSATYDLDEMETNPWEFEMGLANEEQIAALEDTASTGSGTVVIWEKADFSVADPKAGKKRSVGKSKNIETEIENYLGLVFHKYMEGKVESRAKLNININGSIVSPFNPVHQDFLDKEWKPIVDTFYVDLDFNGKVERIPYTLTTYKINGKYDEENKPGALEASRLDMSLQGIYPYRLDRILQKPGWLDVISFHPDWNTLRATLDLDPRLDNFIKTDVKKSGIILKDEMWEDLKNALESYKSAVKSINNRRKNERENEKSKKEKSNIHGNSNTIISTASPDIPTADVKRITPNEVEINTLFGPSLTEIKDYSGPGSRESHIQVVDDLEGGLLWEPRLNGADQIILLNRSHPFYKKIYLQSRQSPLGVQGLDFLLYSLANAEWMTRTDRAKEQFHQMRLIMSNNLRSLVLDLPGLEDDEIYSTEFSSDE
jgi:hypothetical protein